MKLSGRSIVKIPLMHLSEASSVPIVADGTVATAAMGEGRNIPLLILDTSSRPDIETMVRAHQEFGPGDATSFWSFKKRRLGIDSPLLLLRITKPSECVIVIEFEMAKGQGVLVDQILWAQGVYLQPGQPGDCLTTTIDNPRILIEIPMNDVFKKRFQSVYEKAIFRSFRKIGMSRTDSKQLVQSSLKNLRGLLHQRIPFRRNIEDIRSDTISPDDSGDTGVG